MEHLQHFGLSQDPFQNEPDLRFYFDGAGHRDGQRRVERSLRQGRSLTVLTGAGGVGKTLMARRIFETLEEEIFETTLMVILPGAADANAVLTRYARQLGVESPSADRSALLAQIYEQLAIIREDGRHALLILDDAHLLSPEGLAEVGGLLNLEYEDRRLVSLLLVGLPTLERCLTGESHLGERVDVRAQLESLDRESTHAYLAHRLTVAGASPGILPGDALSALFEFGHGRPRLMNTLADNALFEAYLAGARSLAREHVEKAATDLGISSDPGSTFVQPRPVATPEASPPTSISDAQGGGRGGAALDPLLDASSGGDLASAFDAPGQSGTLDLDAEVEAALGDSGSGDDMLLDAQLTNPPDDHGEATRMILPDEGLDALEMESEGDATRMILPDEAFASGAAVVPGEGPPKDEVDDVEDLFAELIDD